MTTTTFLEQALLSKNSLEKYFNEHNYAQNLGVEFSQISNNLLVALFIKKDKNTNITHIDTDNIAKKINPTNPRKVDILAAKKSIKLLNNCIQGRQDFSFETTLTGKTILQRIKFAK